MGGCTQHDTCLSESLLQTQSKAQAAAAGPLHISLDDLEAANCSFEPASSWGVGRMQCGEGPGPRGWQDVGGLADVRDALQEAMELPTKHAALIARCASSHPPLSRSS